MQEYTILVSEIEELQTLKDLHRLEQIFERAKSTIVNGEQVILARKTGNGRPERFDAFSTLSDLENYRKQVFKYL